MSINRPAWKHSWVEVVQQLNASLLQRLNSDPRPDALWKIDDTQMGLSKPGALRLIWVIEGGSISRGFQAHGPDMPAACIAIRNLRARCELRVVQPTAAGIDARSLQLAEEVLRALLIVWNQQRPADYDGEEPEEQWDNFTGETGPREIVAQFRITLQLLVLKDPYLLKQIQSIDSTGELEFPS